MVQLEGHPVAAGWLFLFGNIQFKNIKKVKKRPWLMSQSALRFMYTFLPDLSVTPVAVAGKMYEWLGDLQSYNIDDKGHRNETIGQYLA